MYDCVVIGAGPAGLTAAIYLRRAQKKVLVLEALNYGGQIINTLDIENYPVEEHISGFDFATKIYEQAKKLGTEVKFEKAIDITDNGAYKGVQTSKETYKAKTIIIATGSENRKLGLDKEEDLVGAGISYCATCDGAFYKDKIVAVVGGGNTALEDALYLTDISKKVYLIHRRDSFRADQATVDLLSKKDNLEFVYNSNVTRLIGTDNLEKIEVTDNDGNKKELNVDGLIVAVGRIPETENFAKIINIDKGGFIIAGEDCHTNIPGIFVAGDTRVKEVRQLVTATSDGAISATEAIKYIRSEGGK